MRGLSDSGPTIAAMDDDPPFAGESVPTRRARHSVWTYVAPVVLLLAVTIVVSIVRGAGVGEEPVGKGGAAQTEPVGTQASTTTSTPAAPVVRRTYVIKSGDTLESIAERYSTDVDELLRLNPEISPTALRPGQKIRLR